MVSGFFSNAVSISDYIASNGAMIGEGILGGKNAGTNSHDLINMNYPGINLNEKTIKAQ
jgi:hypothetical protein